MATQSGQAGPDAGHGSSMSRLMTLLRPYRVMLILAVLLLMGLTAVNIAIPQMISIVFDEVFQTGDWLLLFTVLGTMLGLYVLRNLLYFGGKSISVSVGEDVCFDLRKRLFERLQHMSLQYYHENKPGELSSRVMNDSYVIQQFIQNELPTLIQSVLLFSGIMVTIYVMNWQLALASTIVLPLHMLAFIYLRRPIKKASSAAQRYLADATGNLIEKFLGVEVVKGFTGEVRENQAFEYAIDLSRRSELRGQRFHVLQKVLADLLVGLGMMLLIGFGAYQVMGRPADKALAPGDFIAFFWYIGMLYPTVIEMMSGSAKLTRTGASVDRVYEVLDLIPEEEDDPGDGVLPIRGEIRFEGVTFAYQDGKPVLQDITFEVQPGQVCAIVGPSGSGKTTLVSLVPRLNEPTQGSVLIDGMDNRQMPLRRLRRAVGVAFQEAFLFSSSILENLRYAHPEASREEVEAAMKRIGLHDFVANLPRGYDTVVGDEGLSLSRGQKQMLTLARAILKNPKVLILDEATASIDVAKEATIIPVVLDFMKGKTTLLITHRPELLRHVDKVVHLEGGRVVYDGPTAGFDVVRFAAGQVKDLESHPSTGTEPAPKGSVPNTGAILGICTAIVLGLLCSTSGRVWAAEGDAKQPSVAQTQVQQAPEESSKAQPTQTESTQKVDGQPNGRLLPIPGMSRGELSELVQVVATRLSAELGYRTASIDQANRVLGSAPEGMHPLINLIRTIDDTNRYIQLGGKSFVSQPGQVWLVGGQVAGQGVSANPDLKLVEAMIDQAIKANVDRAKAVTPADLKTARIELSYIEADRC
ncbi:MAG: ABC transporter ATP-binding protein, partial [Gammaproteobacteria bacterium]